MGLQVFLLPGRRHIKKWKILKNGQSKCRLYSRGGFWIVSYYQKNTSICVLEQQGFLYCTWRHYLHYGGSARNQPINRSLLRGGPRLCAFPPTFRSLGSGKMWREIKIEISDRPTPDIVHRFRNFGEDIYVALKGRCSVDIEEIDSSTTTFSVRKIHSRELNRIKKIIESQIENHNFGDSAILTCIRSID